jgi:hypothetical protein
MSRENPVNLPASVRQKLLNRARQQGILFDDVLRLYAAERFLYRIATSEHRGLFILKGAMMFRIWAGSDSRSTKDIDLLARTSNDPAHIQFLLRECCEMDFIQLDGMRFDPESLQTLPLKNPRGLKGVRASFIAYLGTARTRVQIDFGFNDDVYPRPVEIIFPSLLDQPESRLLGYTPETSIAEKTHALVELAEFNSRMKDFHDLYWFQKHQIFELPLLVDAIRNTFHQRGTGVPNTLPSILVPTTQFESAHQKQWNAYLREKRLTGIPKSFQEICRHITTFLEIPLRFAANDKPEYSLQWTPEKGWIHN